ncbi:MAG: hypothetical protein WCY48_02855 [Candidatus Caldatribacteriota bacterium]
MQTQIYSSFLTKKGPQPVILFGYSSKSIPGLEINGLGKYGKGIKEKIIFLTKKSQVRIPLSRFVLNVEIPDEWGEVSTQNVKWLEYAFLLLYWNLAGALPLRSLETCFALGSIRAEGVVEEIGGERVEDLCLRKDFTWITSFEHQLIDKRIDAQDLLDKKFGFRLKAFEQVFCTQ